MKMRSLLVVPMLASVVLFLVTPVRAATLDVGPLGSGYLFSSIQSAIDAALPGDVVLVHDGVYQERIDFSAKAITVRSQNGSAVTTIDAQHTGRVVTFNSGEGTASVLDGFTIKNGAATDNGAGIHCTSSSPTIRNCRIVGNTVAGGPSAEDDCGGGIYLSNSSAVITNCTITQNSAGYIGGGAFFTSSSPVLSNCTFTQNSAYYVNVGAGGGIAFYPSSGTLTNCTISGNSADWGGGGILMAYGSSPTLTDCTISGNQVIGTYPSSCGGGIYISDSSPIIKKCVISGNSAPTAGGGVFCTLATPEITNCTLSGNSASSGGAICS